MSHIINTRILMSDATHFSADEAINPYYYEDDVVNVDTATAEHTTIRDALRQAGVEVIQVESPADSQDGVYTANWALVRDNKAVMAHLPEVRKAEEAHAEAALRDLGFEIIHVPDGLKFSGQGDALCFGNYLFCGQGYRSDLEAQIFAADQLGFERIQLQTVPELDATGNPVTNIISGWADSFFYDIDLALAIIRPPEDGKKGIIAYCPEAFTPESQKILEEFADAEKIIISLTEAKQAFACNLISTGETVIMSSEAPELKAAIEAKGLKAVTPKITELAKGGGYIRCTTLTLN
jgi:N-dimethylarginine dimethylaminohydrolase